MLISNELAVELASRRSEQAVRWALVESARPRARRAAFVAPAVERDDCEQGALERVARHLDRWEPARSPWSAWMSSEVKRGVFDVAAELRAQRLGLPTETLRRGWKKEYESAVDVDLELLPIAADLEQSVCSYLQVQKLLERAGEFPLAAAYAQALMTDHGGEDVARMYGVSRQAVNQQWQKFLRTIRSG